jgi:XTP/dITP diphosphohydrolase
MTLIIGTKNKAKLEQMKSALALLKLDIQGLPDEEFPDIEEDGLTALENARKKATTYAAIIGQPVLSTDNALYFSGLPNDKQPGIHVRHFAGQTERPTDEAALAHYIKLITDLGGQVNGYWEYGFCLAKPNGEAKEMIIKSPRLFVSQSSQKVIAGYPLESIQIDTVTGYYVSEMSSEEKDAFWQRAIGGELGNFIKNNL